MKQKFNPFSVTWNLDSLFLGGSQSPALHAAFQRLKHQIGQFKQKFNRLSDIKKGILYFQKLDDFCHDLQEFISCLLAQNVDDQEAVQLNSKIHLLRAQCESLSEELNALLSELDEKTFASLLADSDLQEIAFHLQERRQQTKEKLAVGQESLIHQLKVDGYQGWNDLYHTLIGKLRIPSPFEGEKELSVGQASNRLNDPNRSIRQQWFQRWEEAWASQEDLAAQILNHLGGFRLSVYHARGWHSILHEPLLCNRMQENTLLTMWETIEKYQEGLQKYLDRKAQLLGIPQLAWYDLESPLPLSSSYIPFEKAADLIIQSFKGFSAAMGAFAQEAFEKCWVEAEDRSGKSPGGFCVFFSTKKESRIFMTYSGTFTNLLTLAHELGHAYHNHEVRELPIFSQQYRMNVAETASTLAEVILLNFMIQETQEINMQLSLLDVKLQRSVIFLMNIQARFLFELDFYQARRKGFVAAKELNFLMEKAQKRAFGNHLSHWHPHFWIAKQHFYITEVPFYNFPYTFGYLFSQGIYAHFKEQKKREKSYASLLRDTGRLTVEELASRHLDVKLNEPFFWESAIKLIEIDISTYLKISLLK